MTHIEILSIIYLTREPIASVHLATRQYVLLIAPYFTRVGALFFASVIENKGNNCAKHNDKAE